MNWDWEKLKQQQQKQEGPPNLNELMNRFKNFNLPGGPFFILLVLLLLLGSSMFYTVEVNAVGVVQRFGRYVRTSQPGLNFKFPAGIEKVTKVKIKRIYKEEFGYQPYRGTEDSATNSPALMLTGDLNVAVVPWIVQYRIKDPYNYLFKVQNVQELLRDMSEAIVRLVVGDRSINEVISKRQEIADEAKVLLQSEMKEAETGIEIVTIELKKTNVPGPVQSSLNEVNQAIQEKEKKIYQAKKDYNQAIPAARGEAEQMIKIAEGYKLNRVNRAKGDVARFKSIYAEYVKAQDVTKRRLYLETLEDLLPRLGPKYIVDSDQKNLLPLLNLGKENGNIQQ